jgi:TM2 domain-containing membrane protein YozV
VPETVRIIDEASFCTSAPGESVLGLAREAALAMGGKITSEDAAAGKLDAKFRYGINPTGIRVTVQLRRATDDDTEVVVAGRIGDSFDVTGAGKAKGRDLLNALVQQIESGAPAGTSPPPGARNSAPVIGTVGFAHRGKSKTVAILLAFLLGGLGAHRFYLGSWGWGLVYLGVSVVGLGVGLPLGVFLSLYDAVRLLLMKPVNFGARFNYSAVAPFTF